MKSFKSLLLIMFVFMLGIVSTVQAQSTDNYLTVTTFVGDVEYQIGEGEWTRVQVNTQIPETAMVRVNNTEGFVVMALSDGSEVKLFGLTSVYVGEVLSDSTDGKRSFFELLAGRIFASVEPSTEQDFRVETESAIAAVRGTKFGVSYGSGDGAGDVTVLEGAVEVSDPRGLYQPVVVNPGQMSTFGRNIAPSAPVQAPAETFDAYGQDFTASDEAVEAEETPAEDEAVEAVEDTADEPVEATDDADSDNSRVNVSDTSVETPDTTDDEADSDSDTVSDEPTYSSSDCSSSGFNWSVGSEVIGDEIWNKLLLAPTLKLDNFTISLYLPVYFMNIDDLITPTNWYNYNTDWNFGTGAGYDKWDYKDAAHDLFMKIRYLELDTEKTYLQLGNIPAMTLGHGMFISDYRNDLQFPAVRRLGFEFNVDFGRVGFESMMADVFMTKLMGFRFYVKPFMNKALMKNMALGISTFIDQVPLGGDVVPHNVWGYGIDLDIPIISMGGFMSMTLFTDIGTMGFNDLSGNTDYALGYGYSAGLLGEILTVEYRAEFKSENEGFQYSYVNQFYDVNRETLYNELLDNVATENLLTYNGFLISAKRDFENIGGISLSYEQLFPAGLEEMGLDITNVDPDNFLHFEVYVDKCLFQKAYGTIAYDRQDFYPKDFFENMLANATLAFNIYYAVADGAYIGFNYNRFYNENGEADDNFGLETLMGL